MELVQRGRQPASVETAHHWSVWAVRLLIVVLVLQIAVLLFVACVHGLLRPVPRPTSPSVEVAPPPGTGRPVVPRSVDVRSYTRFYVDGEQIAYSPEDLTDGVEYAVNYLAAHPRAEIRIVRTMTISRPRR